MMIQCLLSLLLGFVLCSAKYVPRSSLSSDPEVLPYQAHPGIPSHNNALHQGRRLDEDEIESYRRHRYYGITVRDGHNHDYGWREINETGIRSFTSDVDDLYFEQIQLTNWSFRFYGHLHDELWISANGFVTVMADYLEGPCGRAFCEWSGHYYTRYIAPLMTDWNPSANPNSQIYYQFGFDTVTNEHHLIVEWDKLTLYAQNDTYNDSYFSFQVIIEEDGDIIFNYQSLPFDPTTKKLVQEDVEWRYPVKIGLEDAFIYHSLKRYPELDGSKWTYYPLELGWDNITHSLGRSIQIEAFPTCQQFTTCDTCVNYTMNYIDDPDALDCGFCGAIGVCSDALGREIASEADSCMVDESQMQRNFNQCRKFEAPWCWSGQKDPWPKTKPGKTANRACSEATKDKNYCPEYACFELRKCDPWGHWGNITIMCKNESMVPCLEDGDWESTIPGNISTVLCKKGSKDRMVRTCNFYGEWSDVDSSACAASILDAGQITGIALGCTVALVIIAVLIWMVQKQRSLLNDFRRLPNDEDTEMTVPSTQI